MVKISNVSFSDAVHVIHIDAVSIQQELISNDMKNTLTFPFCNNIHFQYVINMHVCIVKNDL